MTALTQWNPFGEMDALQNRLSSFDASCIQAEVKGGALTVKVRKSEQAKARTIAIQGG